MWMHTLLSRTCIPQTYVATYSFDSPFLLTFLLIKRALYPSINDRSLLDPMHPSFISSCYHETCRLTGYELNLSNIGGDLLNYEDGWPIMMHKRCFSKCLLDNDYEWDLLLWRFDSYQYSIFWFYFDVHWQPYFLPSTSDDVSIWCLAWSITCSIRTSFVMIMLITLCQNDRKNNYFHLGIDYVWFICMIWIHSVGLTGFSLLNFFYGLMQIH